MFVKCSFIKITVFRVNMHIRKHLDDIIQTAADLKIDEQRPCAEQHTQQQILESAGVKNKIIFRKQRRILFLCGKADHNENKVQSPRHSEARHKDHCRRQQDTRKDKAKVPMLCLFINDDGCNRKQEDRRQRIVSEEKGAERNKTAKQKRR